MKGNKITSLNEFSAISDITSRMSTLAMAKLFSEAELTEFFDSLHETLAPEYRDSQEASNVIEQFKIATIKIAKTFEEERYEG